MAGGLNDRQRKFCELVVQGRPASRAYEEAGYKARGNAAEVNASKLLRNAKAEAYIAKIREKASKKAEEKAVGHIMSKIERMEWLSKAVTTPIGEIDETSDLCTEHVSGEMGSKVKKVDPLKAMDQLNKMDGSYAPDKVEHTGFEAFFSNLQPQEGLHNDIKGDS